MLDSSRRDKDVQAAIVARELLVVLRYYDLAAVMFPTFRQIAVSNSQLKSPVPLVKLFECAQYIDRSFFGLIPSDTAYDDTFCTL